LPDSADDIAEHIATANAGAMNVLPLLAVLLCALMTDAALGQTVPHSPQAPARVIDIPTRPGVTQRFLLLEASEPQAVVVLFAGGDGGLRLTPDGQLGGGRGNFLVRSRQLFVEQRLSVAVIDAPSDRQSPPYLGGWRQSAGHAEDVRLLMAWLRENMNLPVWLIGTSRGTQSIAAIATRLAANAGPAPASASSTSGNADGIVLTSTILIDNRAPAVPDMALDRLSMPVLVIHHEQDACRLCRYSDIPALMQKLQGTARRQLQTYRGGIDRGDPCEAMSYHGFNGLEAEVVAGIAAWIRQGRS